MDNLPKIPHKKHFCYQEQQCLLYKHSTEALKQEVNRIISERNLCTLAIKMSKGKRSDFVELKEDDKTFFNRIAYILYDGMYENRELDYVFNKFKDCNPEEDVIFQYMIWYCFFTEEEKSLYSK